MKLGTKKMILITFMLFSLFFGAGNLIFPTFLGQNAGSNTPIGMLGFIITAVILPVLGVIVVSKFGGLDVLGQRVNKYFGIGFAVLIYLAIGPGLGIPRAASVPFEMAVAPYLSDSSNNTWRMLLYSFIFFLVALWLCLKPSKLVERIGRYLTPSLLFLLIFLFISFLINGDKVVVDPNDTYKENAFLVGFTEGYNTMDAIAALNFGLVIATTLNSFGITDKKKELSYSLKAGLFAGIILALIYVMLAYMGMNSSGVYSSQNGAQTLRLIVYQLYGNWGAILIAAIFTLACLTTCIGLINSISQYFSKLFPKINYTKWVVIITFVSFVICNLGLNTILSVSIPILNAIYPVSIVLIILGLSDYFWKNNKIIYPLTVTGVGIISIIYALEQVNFKLSFLSNFLSSNLPLYSLGYGWVLVFITLFVLSILIDLGIKIIRKKII